MARMGGWRLAAVIAGLMVALAGCGGVGDSTATPAATATTLPAALVNPGFEAAGSLAGWTSGGAGAAFSLEPGGHSGKYGLRQRSSGGPFQARTAQTLGGLADGWYTLRAWARTSSGAAEAAIGLQDCGRPDQQAAVPVAPPERWLQVVVSAEVKGGHCTVVLSSAAGAQ